MPERTDTGLSLKNTGYKTARYPLHTASALDFTYLSSFQSQSQVLAQFHTTVEASSIPFIYSQIVSLADQVGQVISLIFFYLTQLLLFLVCLIHKSRSNFYLEQVNNLEKLLRSQYCLSSFTAASLASINMSSQTGNSKSKTPFLNDNLATLSSLPVIPEEFIDMSTFEYFMTMPQPGSSDIFYFEGKNIIEFLVRYDDMCSNFRVTIVNKIQRLPRYCDMLIENSIEGLPKYKERKWSELRKLLLRDYKASDFIQNINSKTFLKAYKNKVRTGDEDFKNYCRKFQFISSTFIARGKLNKYTQFQWFIQGIPIAITEKLFFKKGVTLNENNMKEFDILIIRTMQYIENKRRLTKMLRVDKDTSLRYSVMTDQFDKRVQLSFHNDVNGVLKPSIASVQTTVTHESDKTMTAMTEKLDALILAMSAQRDVAPTTDQSSTETSDPEPGTHAYAKAHDLCTFCQMTDRDSPI